MRKLVRIEGEETLAEQYLRGFEDYMRERGMDFFEPARPIVVARAPGRIDLMGGIADYCGSVVFESPLREAVVAAYQQRTDTLLRVRSALLESLGEPCEVTLPLEALRENGRPLSHERARTLLTSGARDRWAAYVLGAVPVLEAEGVVRLERGANMLIWSDVPVGVGVASSAALEVAAMSALLHGLGASLPAERLAALAQVVENRVVGAPCGIMDQVTSALGQTDKLLALRCQPCEVLGQHSLPTGVAVFGISSRVQHNVAGEAYTAARVSAFMGLKIIHELMRRRGERVTDEHAYLCNIDPEAYLKHYRESLGSTFSGSVFLERHGETDDPVTRVDPDRFYRVRAAVDHHIFENRRVQAFIACIDRAHTGDRTALVEAGGLMYASHWSYGWNCGLGSPETDLLVRLVRERGPEQGLYGAKITGGGSGGTVAILADREAEENVRNVAARYERITGIKPDIFSGSGPG